MRRDGRKRHALRHFRRERNLLDVEELSSNMKRLRELFDLFEQRSSLMRLLEISNSAEGVQIFIGGESGIAPLDECSVITAPYVVDGQVVGSVGVIGPTRMAYERVIPIVDITARCFPAPSPTKTTLMPRFFPNRRTATVSRRLPPSSWSISARRKHPTAPALKRYLGQFLSDPRVVEIPKPLWWLILNGIILNIRPKKSAAKYATVWMPEGSPLRVHTERQAKLLKGLLGQRGHHLTVTWPCATARRRFSRYVLAHLKAEGARRILLVPMYPQYAASTTATVVDEAARWLLQTRNQPEMRFIRNFHDHPGYLAALEKSVRKHWQANGRSATTTACSSASTACPNAASISATPISANATRPAACWPNA
jgi:hypothetical protein